MAAVTVHLVIEHRTFEGTKALSVPTLITRCGASGRPDTLSFAGFASRVTCESCAAHPAVAGPAPLEAPQALEAAASYTAEELFVGEVAD
jgi:hypothetical protein